MCFLQVTAMHGQPGCGGGRLGEEGAGLIDISGEQVRFAEQPQRGVAPWAPGGLVATAKAASAIICSGPLAHMAARNKDSDYGELGPAFPPWPGPADGAILQPPKTEIQPSALVLERTANRAADREAAD